VAAVLHGGLRWGLGSSTATRTERL
jgi:hypothetical protein